MPFETARIPCAKCGAMILPATAKVTGGFCLQCHPAKARKPGAVAEHYDEAFDAALRETQSLEQATLAVCRMPLSTIRICAIESPDCPGFWDCLETTDNTAVRRCRVCSQSVFLCLGDAETLSHARAGHCLARRGFGFRVLRTNHEFEPPPPLSPEDQAVLETAQADYHRMKALNRLKYSSRFCPQCGYPCPNWEESCYVCSHHLGVVK